VYPGATWDLVVSGASKVKTVAIINPNSGPANSVDSSYKSYMQKLDNAGVEMVGYVYTGYGGRAISAVKADIDKYASQYPLLKGIFLDEVAATDNQVAYYKQLYDYVMGMPGWTHDIINPGTVPTTGYFAASTSIVSLENYGSSGTGTKPSFATCDNKEHFSAIVHTVGSGSMQSTIDALMA